MDQLKQARRVFKARGGEHEDSTAHTLLAHTFELTSENVNTRNDGDDILTDNGTSYIEQAVGQLWVNRSGYCN